MKNKGHLLKRVGLPSPVSCHLSYKHDLRFWLGELDNPQNAFKIVGELPTRYEQEAVPY